MRHKYTLIAVARRLDVRLFLLCALLVFILLATCEELTVPKLAMPLLISDADVQLSRKLEGFPFVFMIAMNVSARSSLQNELVAAGCSVALFPGKFFLRKIGFVEIVTALQFGSRRLSDKQLGARIDVRHRRRRWPR